MWSNFRADASRDGSLADPELIVRCGDEAVRQLDSVVVEATIDLGALFMGATPPGADPIPAIEMEIRRVFPNDVNAILNIPEAGEVNMIFHWGRRIYQ